MHDLAVALLWLCILGGGFLVCVAVRRLGVPATYVRDLLHVCSGVWVFSWRFFDSRLAPSLIVLLALALTASVPWLARRFRSAAALHSAVCEGEEGWTGIFFYVVSYTWVTIVSFPNPAPGAAALLALSAGDGIGGLIGRTFGTHTYQVPWAKPRSIEGSLAVATASLAAGLVAVRFYGWGWDGCQALLVSSLVAAVAEALSPKALDNLIVPAAVWLVLMLS